MQRLSIAAGCLMLALCACKPQPPEKEQPPEPQAAQTDQRDGLRGQS